MIEDKNNNQENDQLDNNSKLLLCLGLSENDLVELGFSKNLMAGTGWNTINSMRDAVYYYKKGRITINASRYWTWFLDNDQRNDVSVNNKEALSELLITYA
jgi:hypothetical protein